MAVSPAPVSRSDVWGRWLPFLRSALHDSTPRFPPVLPHTHVGGQLRKHSGCMTWGSAPAAIHRLPLVHRRKLRQGGGSARPQGRGTCTGRADTVFATQAAARIRTV